MGHLAGHYGLFHEGCGVPGMLDLRSRIKLDIVGEFGDILAKNFGTSGCVLCRAERYTIVRGIMSGRRLMNSNSEIHASCRHRAKFPRLALIDNVD